MRMCKICGKKNGTNQKSSELFWMFVYFFFENWQEPKFGVDLFDGKVEEKASFSHLNKKILLWYEHKQKNYFIWILLNGQAWKNSIWADVSLHVFDIWDTPLIKKHTHTHTILSHWIVDSFSVTNTLFHLYYFSHLEYLTWFIFGHQAIWRYCFLFDFKFFWPHTKNGNSNPFTWSR